MKAMTFYRKQPCDNCPFTPGTQAASTEATAKLAKMCTEHDIPFMCHKTMKAMQIGEIMGHPVVESYPTKICAGWIAARVAESKV